MKKKVVIVGLALLAVAGVAWASRRGGSGGSSGGDDSPPEVYDPGAASYISSLEDWTEQLYFETQQAIAPMPQIPFPATNVAAFLEMIKQSEGTAGQGDPYRVCYGYRHTIVSFFDHPAVTKEWRGETLSDAMCAGAGLGSGCVSTAAGAYQIIKPTWTTVKGRLGLPDFSPASQDAAAVELLRQRGALAFIEAGRLEDAIYAARKEWASLKGAGYGQGERSIPWLTAKFTDAGGVLA